MDSPMKITPHNFASIQKKLTVIRPQYRVVGREVPQRHDILRGLQRIGRSEIVLLQENQPKNSGRKNTMPRLNRIRKNTTPTMSFTVK